MPPKKKGGAAASPAAKKRVTTPARKGPPKKRQDAEGTSLKEQAVDTSPITGFDGGATADESARAAPTEEQAVAVSPGKEEAVVSGSGARRGSAAAKEKGFKFDEAHAAARTSTAATASCRDAPAESAVDVVASKGEVNGFVGSVAVAKDEVGEGTGVASAGLPEKGQDAHVAAGNEEAEEAAVSATVAIGGAGTEVTAAEDASARGDVAASNGEEDVTSGSPAKGGSAGGAVKMEVDDGPGAGTPSSSAAANALPIASAVAELPAPLLLQMDPPSLSISHSVDELRGLSTVLSTFTRCWDRLSDHLGSIQASMDTLMRAHGGHGLLTTPATRGRWRREEIDAGADEKKKGEGVGETEEKDVKEMGGAEEAKRPQQPQKAPPLNLESICEKMLGRNLRRYVVAHMSDVDRLREEVPRALRLAPDPAKLVLSCIGRFYLQGSRAYVDPNSPMVSVRRACILVLEFFLLSGCSFSGSVCLPSSSDATISDAVRTEKPAEGKEGPSSSVMEEAKVAAVAWKNRLVAEGGVASASAVDALGLALFVASFGIPSDFDSEMMYDVFRLCNMKKKADTLRQSPIILEMLPDIIQDLVQNEKYIAAADLACGFGLQEKYPPLDLISSFLIKTNTDVKEERREGQSSMTLQKEAAASQLSAYKSVIKCLEDHKLDPSSLASFKIEEKISKLEKDIAMFEKKLKDQNLKRKAENVELTYGAKGSAKRPASTLAKATSRVKPAQDHGRTLALSRNLYGSSGSRFLGLLDGSGVGNPAGNVLGSTGAGARLAATSGLSAGSGYPVGNGILPSAESGVSYRWHQEGALGDGSIGHSYAGMGHSGQRSLTGPSAESLLQQQPPSVLGTGSRVIGSSLYEFADNVMENDLCYGRSVRSNVLSNSTSGHR